MISFTKNVIRFILITLMSTTAADLRAQEEQTIAQVNFRFERVTNQLKRKYQSDSGVALPYINRIENYKNIIVAAEDHQTADFAKSLYSVVQVLETSLAATDTFLLMTSLRDAEADLSIKTEEAVSFNLTGAGFQKVAFNITVGRMVQDHFVVVNAYKIRANSWGNRDAPGAAYTFNDQVPDPQLTVELVRGNYGFWLEPIGTTDTSSPRVFIKITVSTKPTMINPVKLYIP
jgi:hypothetical protein